MAGAPSKSAAGHPTSASGGRVDAQIGGADGTSGAAGQDGGTGGGAMSGHAGASGIAGIGGGAPFGGQSASGTGGGYPTGPASTSVVLGACDEIRTPSIAVARSGAAVAAWERSNTGVIQVYASVRPAGGAWSAAQIVSTQTQVSVADGLSGAPHVAVDDAGDAVVTWWELPVGSADVGDVRAALYDTANDWRADASLLEPGVDANVRTPDGFYEEPAVGIDGDGDVFVAFIEDPGDPPHAIVVTRHDATTNKWTPARMGTTDLADELLVQAMSVGKSGTAIVAWEEVLNNEYAVAANVFTPELGWTGELAFTHPTDGTSVVADDMGNAAIGVVQYEYDSAEPFNDTQMTVASYDATTGWTAPTAVNDLVAAQVQTLQVVTNGSGQFMFVFVRANQPFATAFAAGSPPPLATAVPAELPVDSISVAMNPSGQGVATMLYSPTADVVACTLFGPGMGWEMVHALLPKSTAFSVIAPDGTVTLVGDRSPDSQLSYARHRPGGAASSTSGASGWSFPASIVDYSGELLGTFVDESGAVTVFWQTGGDDSLLLARTLMPWE